MKFIKIASLAVMLALFAAPLFVPSATTAQAQEPKPPASGQQKQGKDKKPAEDEGAQDDQVLKIGTQLVTVPFNVTDKTNRYINELSKDEIEVLEDNKP